MYQHILGFSPGAVAALYDNQGIMTIEQLQEVTNSLADKTCHTIQKPGGNEQGHLIPIIMHQRLKLISFWSRHILWTSREPEDIHEMTWNDIKHLVDQKTLEDNDKYGDVGGPEMTLEQTTKTCTSSTVRPWNYPSITSYG